MDSKPKSIGIGFVGLSANGWAATQLAGPLFEEPLKSRYRLVAVCTTNAESATATAKKYTELTGYPVKAYHGSAKAISNDPDVDLVVVAVKTPDHRDPALAAIDAGKDLFLEWAVGGTSKIAQEIADAAKRKGVKTIIGTQGRQSLAIKELKPIVESGRFGRMLSTTVSATLAAEINFWGPTISEGVLYFNSPRSGASFFDIAGGHFLEPFMFALGPITSVFATAAIKFPTAQVLDAGGQSTGKTVQNQNPDQIAVSGTLANGAVYNFHFRSGVEARATKTVKSLIWTIDFEHGSIRLESDHPAGCLINITEPRLFVDGEEVILPDADKPAHIKNAWLEYTKGESGNYPTIEDGVKLRRILDAVFESSETGKRIDLD